MLVKKLCWSKKDWVEKILSKKLGRNYFGVKKNLIEPFLGPNSFLNDLSVLCGAVLITSDLNNNREFDW